MAQPSAATQKPLESGETVIESDFLFEENSSKFAHGKGERPCSDIYDSIVSRRPGDSALSRMRRPEPAVNALSAASGSLARRSTASGGSAAAASGCAASSSGASRKSILGK